MKVRSLQTSDRALAVKRAFPILSQWRAEWDAPSPPPIATASVNRPSLEQVAVAVAHDQFLAALERNRSTWPTDDEGYGAALAKRRADQRRYARLVREKDLTTWQVIADNIIEKRGLDVERGSHAYTRFVDILADANVAAIDVFNRQTDGDLNAESRSRAVRDIKTAAASKAPRGETLLDLYDVYARWRCEAGRKRRRRPELFEHDRVAVALFTEFVGRDRKVCSITKDDAKAFRAMLSAFPASRGKKGSLASLSIDECVAIAKRDRLATLSLTTQAKYLSILSPFFAWLVSDSTVSVPINIFDGLHHKLERGEHRRPPFSAAQLNTLLQSPLFGKCAGDRREHLPGEIEVRDWRYWIPLLCMCTGSRITEVAQLHVDDVDTGGDAPLVLLSHDETKGQFVKGKKTRLAALHKTLIDAGFLEYYRKQFDRAERDGNRQLFPELVAGKRDLLGDKPSKWFRRYLPRIGIKSGADGYGSHSFRHTMADAMRAANYMDLEYGQLVLGHANNSITAAYGSAPQGTPARLLSMLNDAFEAKPFIEVDFKYLFGDRS